VTLFPFISKKGKKKNHGPGERCRSGKGGKKKKKNIPNKVSFKIISAPEKGKGEATHPLWSNR